MFTYILLPTDGSELSGRALDTGIALAARLGARIHVFHVVVPLPATAYFAEMIQATQAAYDEEATKAAARLLEEAARRAQAAGVACTVGYVVDARPGRAIVEAANARGCDLIVMGSHGWRGFDRLLLGSETHKVILDAATPVLVCH